MLKTTDSRLFANFIAEMNNQVADASRSSVEGASSSMSTAISAALGPRQVSGGGVRDSKQVSQQQLSILRSARKRNQEAVITVRLVDSGGGGGGDQAVEEEEEAMKEEDHSVERSS